MGFKWLLALWFPILVAGAESQRYIVELSGDPIAEHVAKERKRTGKPVEMNSDVALTRQTQLRSEQRQVRRKLEDLGVKILDSIETISNSLIVDVPDELADKVAAIPGVKRVQQTRPFKPTLDHAVALHKVPQAWNRIGVDKAGLGIKIAIIDSGIEISHPGMQDSTLMMPAGFPKMNADSDVAFTNSKVIVARSYASLFSTVEDDISARDLVGHGTAVAMAAAGALNSGSLGPLQGVAPKAYLGSYKVLGANGGGTSDIILKAVDDAVKDGMDVISASISSKIAAPRLEDDVEVDAFERVAGLGVLMINSVGNKGDPNTIGSPATAPSVIGVGASYNDRTFYPASVKVGDGPLLGAMTANGQRPDSPISGPLFDVSTLDINGEACLPFPIGSMTGKIALILRSPLVGGCLFETKLNNVQGGGAIAAVIYTTIDRPLGSMNVGAATLPALMIGNVDGVAIKNRLHAETLIARMDFMTTSVPASSDGVADFSSKGPNVNGSIKPDLVAVGTDFYTATQRTVPAGELYSSTGYKITDGTSFSAPLVAGAAALLKGARPGLTAAQYRSLLINTAAPITARVQEAGAGLLDMNAALQSTFAIAPTSLSLGIGAANPNLSKTLTISNIGTSTESYSLTVAPRDAGVPAPALGVSTVTLQPGQSASVPITFSGSGLTAGQYEGFLKIRGTISGLEERVPYWYGVASDVPATITPLWVKGKDDSPTQYKAGTSVNNAIYFRVTDASGIIIANAQPTVTAFSGGGSVISTISLDRNLPGVFSVSVRLGVNGGDNVFRIKAGNLEPLEVTITGNTNVTPPSCSYALSSNGQPIGGRAFGSGTGSGSFAVAAPTGCTWSATSNADWVSVIEPSSGSGNGSVSYQVAANNGAGRSGTVTVAGIPFTIEQQAASIAGLSYVGAMPHIAAKDVWTTTFTLVNKSTSAATARLSMFGDPAGALTLPLVLPQVSPTPLLASSLDRAIAGNASLLMNTGGPQTPPVQVGSAQLLGTGAVDGFAIFRLIPGAQEAVVPLETRNAGSYLLVFDNTGGVVLGVAVQNVSSQAATIPVVIRDDGGVVISAPGTTLSIGANGHSSFVLSTQYPVTANKRGTIEFDTPAGGRISVLGIRTTPLGNTLTLTTIPALADIGTSGGSIAHIATGNGWQTTFVLVNAGAQAAQATLKFFATGTGSPLSIPLSFPQSGAGSSAVASSVTRTLAAGATLVVQSAAPLLDPSPTTGSAQLTTAGNIGGFVIFRYNPNGQEAVVPLESRIANGYILAFDNTNGTATGIALNSVSSQTVNVPVIVRDESGTQIATDTLSLAANGHLAFTLAADKYPATANIRGTIEFGTPPGGQIAVLGIRIPVAHTFTTLPPLAR